jgi:hypothetical protein
LLVAQNQTTACDNNCSIVASYGTTRIFAGLGFGASTASRSIISRPRRGIDPAFQAARHG